MRAAWSMLLVLAVAIAFTSSASAEDKKVTLKGTLTCAKCDLKKEDKCTTVLVVIAAGLVVRAPLQRVPENAIKFTVGAMITAFGTFWTLEAVVGHSAWPWGDWSLLGLATFYGLGGLFLMTLLRKRPIEGEVR